MYRKNFINTYFTSLSAPPLFWATVFIIIGISWQRYVGFFYISYALWLSFIILSLLYYQTTKRITFNAIICASAFLIGCTLYKHQMVRQESWHLIADNQTFDYRVTIEDITCKHNTRLQYSYLCKLHSLEQGNNFIFCDKKISFLSSKKLNYQVGDIVMFEDIKSRKPNAQSLQEYIIKEHIGAIIILNEQQKHHLIYRPTCSFNRWLHNYRGHIFNAIKQKCTTKTFALISLLFFGNKAAIPKSLLSNLKIQCKQWGISHYLARSGLHLVIIVGVWHTLLYAIPVSFYLKQIFVLLLTLIYLLLSWTSLSFFRSFMVFFVYKIGFLTQRSAHNLNIIVVTALLVLITSPMQLYALDFQLSFGITFLLAWLNQLRHANLAHVPTIA